MINFFYKNRTTLLILMLSMVVLMILPAVILKHYFHQDLKNWQVLLTPLVTIVLYISGLTKLDEWMSTKKKNTCIELMEIISNIQKNKTEWKNKFDEEVRLNSAGRESDVIKHDLTGVLFLDDLYAKSINLILEAKEKTKTLKILNIKYSPVIDELIDTQENVFSNLQQWKVDVLVESNHVRKLWEIIHADIYRKVEESLMENQNTESEYTSKKFNKLFTIN